MPRCPWSAAYLYRWWEEIAAGRQSGMQTCGITWEAMDAWARRMNKNPTPDEWRLIRAIDSIFLEVMRADT